MKFLPLLAILFVSSVSQAATLVIDITDSSYIRSSAPDTVQGTPIGGAVSNLIGDIAAGDDDTRAIFAVSLADPVLAGQTITNATLNLTVSFADGTSSNSSTETLQLFQLTQSFVENQATWNSRSTGNAWTSAGGGTFSGSALAEVDANPAAVEVGDALDFGSSASLTSLVQSSIGNTLYFIVKLEDESDDLRSLFRVGSDDNATASLRPQFTVDYVPEPTTFAMLLGGMASLMLFRRRRQS